MTNFVATYRLQLGPGFRFADARRVVPYLRRLGVSHLYLSPIWQARAGSSHGYDVVDPTRVSEELGGEEAFADLARAGLGVVLDVVPNHMAAHESNPFWSDPELRARFFDVDRGSGFHRRFFDIDDLVGVRVEEPEVFDTTHRKPIELVSAGLADGLRIDHLDGLARPLEYLRRLSERGVAHVWVEKILETEEELRPWPIEGTTGYDFLNDVTALFVERSAEGALTALAGDERPFSEVADEAKLEQVRTVFGPEVEALQRVFDVPEIDRGLASLPVYRTYVDPVSGTVDEADRRAIDHLPLPLRPALTLEAPSPEAFVIRFQQTTGAVMAKGVEDTALYRYVRLLALNEVGGDPSRFGLSIEEFHAANARRARSFPRSMLAAQTHDTKRSGDVRARLTALSYLADEWCGLARRWHELASGYIVDGAPDWSEELFVYQTLVSGWPIGMDRLEPYLQKVLREAKRNTNWLEPNEQWEKRVFQFCDELCRDGAFLSSFAPFAERVALEGERISLAQQALRLTAPGVPDIYQGDENWTFSFVDPDNRRPVDWAMAGALLDGLEASGRVTRENAKLFVTRRLLDLRRRHPECFGEGYSPLAAGASTCAYRRGEDVVVAVATRPGRQIEADLPLGSWQNLLSELEGVYPLAGLAVYERQ